MSAKDFKTEFKTLQLDELYPSLEGSCHLLLGCRGVDYAGSRVASAVEDAGAQLLNLNLMLDPSGAFELLIEIRINRLYGEAVARSLMRYDYEIVAVDGNRVEADDSALRQRIDELMLYLNM